MGARLALIECSSVRGVDCAQNCGDAKEASLNKNAGDYEAEPDDSDWIVMEKSMKQDRKEKGRAKRSSKNVGFDAEPALTDGAIQGKVYTMDSKDDMISVCSLVSREETKDGSVGITISSFEKEFVIHPATAKAVREALALLISTAGSLEAAGQVFFSALSGKHTSDFILHLSPPSTQTLSSKSQSILAMNVMTSLADLCAALRDPPKLQNLVKDIAFSHFYLDVTMGRAIIFRDTILEVFATELGRKFCAEAQQGWKQLLNYVCGGLLSIRSTYC